MIICGGDSEEQDEASPLALPSGNHPEDLRG
jgi:hypothetical protein